MAQKIADPLDSAVISVIGINMDVQPDSPVSQIEDLLQSGHTHAGPRRPKVASRIQTADFVPTEIGHPACAIGRTIHGLVVAYNGNTIAARSYIELDFVCAHG